MKPGKVGGSVTPRSAFKSIEDQNIVNHINDDTLHTSSYEKAQIEELKKDFSNHKNDGNIHVSEEQIENWSSKETPKGAQDKVNKVKSLINKHENDDKMHISQKERENFGDKYTRAEVHALLSTIVSSIKWVEEVETFDQIKIVHTNPSEHDTCTVLDTGLSYTYNGKNWVVSLVSFFPLATTAQDGKMSKEDKQKLDDIEKGANNYKHPDDEFTRHVTDSQIESWDNKAEDVEATTVNRGQMSPTDKKKLNSVEYGANFYQHPNKHSYKEIETDENHQFISQDEKEYYESKIDPDILELEIIKAIDEAKRYVNNTISSLSNSTPELYTLLMSIRKELSADAVGVLLKQIADKVDNATFETHLKDKNIHLTPELLKKIDNVLTDPKSDWNETNVDSPKYIENKPEALPAKGGDSDTVGGYKPAALFANRKAATITIGTLKANCLATSVDFICDGTNDTEIIQKAFDSISGFGGKILFREGTYIINKPLILNRNNIILDSLNATLEKTFSEGVLLFIIGDNVTVQNFTFKHSVYPKDNNLFIEINGSRNKIQDNHFHNGCGINLSGSYNIISHNIIVDSFYGIKIIPDKNNAIFNTIVNNIINGGQYGIILKANSWSILHNSIKNNKIANCGIGVWLTSIIAINDKVGFCDISSNHILRGLGDDSAYGTNQKDILVDYGIKNIISNNVLKKTEIRGSKNMVANNINI